MAKKTKIDKNTGNVMYEIKPDLWCDQDQTTINAIAPISHIESVKDIAIEYIEETVVGNQNTRDDMLPIRLSPTGNEPATHILCSIYTSVEDGNNMAKRLLRENGRGKTFCSTVKRNNTAPKALINSSFTIVECSKSELLTKMGLKEIN